MHKQWEEEPWRLEHADDAKITFTIALHGEHAWEMLLEDSHRYQSISHGWATDNSHDWEEVIAPVLRRLFVNGRLGFATKVHMYDSPNASSANANVAMYDPPLCSPANRKSAEKKNPSDGTQINTRIYFLPGYAFDIARI